MEDPAASGKPGIDCYDRRAVIQTQYAKSAGASLAFQVTGTGEPTLLYVPGAVSHLIMETNYPVAARYLDGLARFSRLVKFDKRGAGLSDLGDIPPTIAAQVPDVEAVRGASDSDRVALYGLSQGAAVALLYTRQFPERVSHLILVEGICCDARDPTAPLSPDNVLMDWDGFFASASRDFAGFTRDFARICFPHAEPESLDEFANFFQVTTTPASFKALWRGVLGLDLRPILKEINVPTLVIHTRGDRHHPVEQGRHMAEQIPGARYLEIDSDSHLPNLEEEHVPEILTAIEAFLTGTVRHTAERRVATILFTDIVASTQQQHARGDEAWRDLLERHAANTVRLVQQFGGRVVEAPGDGAMAEFPSPGEALRAARALVQSAREEGIQVRAGLHAGEVYDVKGRLIGLCVNCAARTVAEAGADEIFATGVVHGLVEGSGFEFDDRGEFDLKGIGRRRLLCLQ